METLVYLKLADANRVRFSWFNLPNWKTSMTKKPSRIFGAVDQLSWELDSWGLKIGGSPNTTMRSQWSLPTNTSFPMVRLRRDRALNPKSFYWMVGPPCFRCSPMGLKLKHHLPCKRHVLTSEFVGFVALNYIHVTLELQRSCEEQFSWMPEGRQRDLLLNSLLIPK